MQRAGEGIARVLAALGIVVSTGWGIWFGWAALVGGSVWVPGGRVVFAQGSILMAALVVFIGIPILDTVVYWITMALVLVVTLPLAAASARGRHGAVPQRREEAASNETRVVEFSDGTGAVFTKDGDHVTWRYVGVEGEPNFMLHIAVQRALTREQLSAGEAPWFPEIADQLAQEHAEQERPTHRGEDEATLF
jgi:hypothetical protein